MEDNDTKYHSMLNEPVEKLVIRFAKPTIAIMLVSEFYHLVDTFFVSLLGISAMAGVGVSYAIIFAIKAIGLFCGTGSGNYISHALGAQKQQQADKMAVNGLFVALFLSSLIALLGLLFLTPLARLLGATDTILPYAKDYLRYILLGAPFMAASFTLNNILRFQGSAAHGMIGMVGGAVLNMVLDPIFIFVLRLGVSGAGLATMLSQFLSFMVLLFYCNKSENVRLRINHIKPDLALYREILYGGSPAFLRQITYSAATICINQLAGIYGDAAIAAFSVVNRIIFFLNSAVVGFGQGFQPVCGFNYGAARFDRVKTAFFYSLRTATMVLLVLALVSFLGAPQIISFFRVEDPQVIEIGARSLRFYCWVMPLWSPITIIGFLLQTTNKANSASILSIARQGLILIPLLYFLSQRLGIIGLQLAPFLSDLLTFILALLLGRNSLKQMREITGD